MASKDVDGGPHDNVTTECDGEGKAPDMTESRKRKASTDASEDRESKVNKEDKPLDNSKNGEVLHVDTSDDIENLHSEASNENEAEILHSEASNEEEKLNIDASREGENLDLEASNDEGRQPWTVETLTPQRWPNGTMTICGIIWSQASVDAAAGVEISREGKPVGIQLTSGGGGGGAGGGGGGSCRFIVDAALRSSDLTWEVMPFERKLENGRLQLFKRSSAAKKGNYLALFPASTTLQAENSNVSPIPAATAAIHHDLTITVKRTTYREAIIEWTSDVPEVDRWLIIIRNEGRTPRQRTEQVRDSEWMIHSDDKSLNRIDQSLVSLEYEAGHKYTVAVYGLREETKIEEIRRYIIVANSTTSFRAEHTKEDLERLLAKARGIMEYPARPFSGSHNSSNDFGRCQWLYRDKPAKYFRKLEREHNNIMEVYDKDANGDPASVLHGQLKGLFFSANIRFGTSEPRKPPIFGDRRVMIPALKMLSEDWKIYFADLYCLNTYHLATLVLAEPGSEADQFCAEKLVSLSRTDRRNNPFLFVENGTVHVKSRITVEVFYTKNIDLKLLESEYNGRREENPGWRNMTHGEKWKKKDCPTCNLYTSRLPGAIVV